MRDECATILKEIVSREMKKRQSKFALSFFVYNFVPHFLQKLSSHEFIVLQLGHSFFNR